MTTPQLGREARGLDGYDLDEYDILARELDVVSPAMSELDEYEFFTA
jgi:hypothetical protein